jgi:hypothetical protein
MLWGAQTISQSQGTMRRDPAVQRALGRTGGAEQATLARPVQARTTETVDQLRRGSWSSRTRSGQPPHQRFAKRLWWGAVAVPPLPLGAQAEGRERTWLGRNRSKTGRNGLRWPASAYRDLLHETWWRGQASAVPALTTALGEWATRRGWPRERRQRLVLRLEGGFGTTAGRTWLLRRGSQVVAKSRHSGRVRKVRHGLGPWQPTASPGREIAAVLPPHRFCRATRPWVLRTPQAQGG